MKLAFVILQYINYQDTINCIKSIQSQTTQHLIDIVVVDNQSPNNALALLEEQNRTEQNRTEQNRTEQNIHYVQSASNQSFARGNNVGYRYALDKCGADFVICLNSDVVLTDTEFCNKLVTEHNTKQYHLAGPDIITPTGWHQNPLSCDFANLNKAWIQTKQRQAWLGALLRVTGVLEIAKHLKQKLGIDKRYRKSLTNITLQGSCIIYSPLWTATESDAFYPHTNFFFEEYILSTICHKKGYTTRYLPHMQVAHMAHSSTKQAFNSLARQFKFRYVNYRYSLGVMLAMEEM